MSEELWLLGLRVAGGLHFLTLALAWFTPVPRDWEGGLSRLSPLHRRFSIAQNVAVGAVLVFCGYISLVHAQVLLSGDTGGRLLSAGIGLWWGGRLMVLPWLRVGEELNTTCFRIGFAMLCAQCAIYAVAYGWLALGR